MMLKVGKCRHISFMKIQFHVSDGDLSPVSDYVMNDRHTQDMLWVILL